MTFEEIFEGLFPIPYQHGKWIADQNILIERLKSAKDSYLTEQADKLKAFQDGNQASKIMIDIVAERVKKHLTTEKISDSINNDDAIVDACG